MCLRNSYGDGIVESITVPCIGGGFSVGVVWDDPQKGGPTFSAEGGGRGANHLLVIEAAPDTCAPHHLQVPANRIPSYAAKTACSSAAALAAT